MFLPDEDTMRLVSLITEDPSDENIDTVIKTARSVLPDEMSIAAEIELIANAVDPVHPGIKEKLHHRLENTVDS